MLFTHLPELDHPLARLRPLRAEDLPAWRAILHDPRVFTPTSWAHPEEADLAPALGSHLGQAPTAGPDTPLRLALAARDDDRLLGTIGLHSLSSRDRRAELAYELHPDTWGRGLASAAVRSIARWARDHWGLARLQATVLVGNERSCRVLQRCGFICEGRLQAFRQVRGRAGDFWMFAWTGGAQTGLAAQTVHVDNTHTHTHPDTVPAVDTSTVPEDRMLHHISLAVSDLARAARFYDAVMGALGWRRVFTGAHAVGYGRIDDRDRLLLNLRPGSAPPGPGFHLALRAASTAAIESFHAAGLAAGGQCNGPAGPRPHYGPCYHAAFLIDPDGHRLEAVLNEPLPVAGH